MICLWQTHLQIFFFIIIICLFIVIFLAQLLKETIGAAETLALLSGHDNPDSRFKSIKFQHLNALLAESSLHFQFSLVTPTIFNAVQYCLHLED